MLRERTGVEVRPGKDDSRTERIHRRGQNVADPRQGRGERCGTGARSLANVGRGRGPRLWR
jgi:hypothetical protein